MDLFKWSDDYSVLNETLDNEHKKLFTIINDLYTAFMNREENEKIGELLAELHKYTVYHFTHEEEILSKMNTPISSAHKAKHTDFIEKVSSMKQKHDEGKSTVKYEMMNFLRTWLQEHIKGTDKEYSYVFTKKAM